MCPGSALLGCTPLGFAFVRNGHGSTIVQSLRRDKSIGIYKKARIPCKQEISSPLGYEVSSHF